MVGLLVEHKRAEQIKDTVVDVSPSANKGALLPDAIDKIQCTFGLTIKELVTVCQSKSLKVLYSWKIGKSKPNELLLKRLFDLVMLAIDWEYRGYSHVRLNIHQPVIDELSIYDLLNQSEIDKGLVLFACSRLHLLLVNQRMH